MTLVDEVELPPQQGGESADLDHLVRRLQAVYSRQTAAKGCVSVNRKQQAMAAKTGACQRPTNLTPSGDWLPVFMKRSMTEFSAVGRPFHCTMIFIACLQDELTVPARGALSSLLALCDALAYLAAATLPRQDAVWIAACYRRTA
jgi:hypothetical protein